MAGNSRLIAPNCSGSVTNPRGAVVRYVLLHGLASSPNVWSAVKMRMRKELPNGKTDLLAPTLVMDGSIEDEADRVASAMAVPAGSGTIVGHSMGGLVAVALSERHPELVERLVLVNSPTSVEARLSSRNRTERALRNRTLGPALWRVKGQGGARRGLTSAFAPGFEVPQSTIDELLRTSYETFVNSTEAIDAYLAATPLARRLEQLDVPITVLFGTSDQRVDPSVALTQYRSAANVSVHPMSYVGHTPPIENSLATFRAIISDEDIASYLQEDRDAENSSGSARS